MREDLLKLRSQTQQREECLLKVFGEKEELREKYELVKNSMQDELKKAVEKGRAKEAVARAAKREREGRNDESWNRRAGKPTCGSKRRTRKSRSSRRSSRNSKTKKRS